MRDTGAKPLAGKKLLSYGRISDDTERDQHGVIDQRGTNQRNAELLGATVIGELEDNDKSVTRANNYREDFERLIRALTLGLWEDGTVVDGVIVVEQSRIARTHAEWERYSDALTSQEGRVHVEGSSVMDPYSDTFDLHGAFGTYTNKSEVKKIKVRTRRSHRRRALEGIPVGGNRPFGWLPDRRNLDPVEASAARRAVRGFLDGQSLHSLVLGLQQAGLTTTKGNGWTMDALRKFLANPRLCGYRMLDGELVRDEAGQPVVGQWEPLISVEEWEAVQAVFEGRKGTRIVTPAGGPKHLLSGLVRCGKCTVRMRGVTRDGTRMYVCPSKSQGGCGGVGRNAERLEFFVVESMLERARALSANTRAEGVWDGETALQEVEDRRDFLNAAWQAKRMSDETYLAQLEPVEQEIIRLRRDRETAARRRARIDSRPADLVAEWRRRDDIEWRQLMLSDALRGVMVQPVGKGVRTVSLDNVRLLWRD